MTNQTEPMPCPWCGITGSILIHRPPFPYTTNRRPVSAGCINHDCKVRSATHDYDTPEAAIAAWNTRHEPHDIGWAVRQMMAGKKVRVKGTGDGYQYELLIRQDGHRVLQVYEDGCKIVGAPGRAVFSEELIATDWEIAE